MIDPDFNEPRVAAAFQAYGEPTRTHLLALRRLIFATAAATPKVGPLFETLKWGQPAYLTPQTKSGSTIRLDATTGGYAVFVHCQTTLLADFQALFPGEFGCEGNRSVRFSLGEAPPLEKLRFLVQMALTYHLR